MTIKDKTIKENMDSLMQFQDHTIGEARELIEATIRASYSTGAYQSFLETMKLFKKTFKND